MEIEKIIIYGGIGKDGLPEKVDQLELKMGDIMSIVGSTGFEIYMNVQVLRIEKTLQRPRIC